MGLVVDAMVERQIVEGFRIGKNLAADMPTWDIWQANNLDASSDQVLLEAAIGGCSFLLVAPPPTAASRRSTPSTRPRPPSRTSPARAGAAVRPG
jgi:hypothetical protein